MMSNMICEKFLPKVCVAIVFGFMLSGCVEKHENHAMHDVVADAGCIFDVNNFNQIEEIVNNLHGKVLVVFDNHDVLTVSNLDILTSKNKQELKNRIKTRMPRSMSDADYRMIFSGFFMLMGSHLTDDAIPRVIATLQKRRNTKVLLCTNSFHGRYGVFKKYEDFIRREFLSFGIDFSKNWQTCGGYVLKNMPFKRSSTFKSEPDRPIFWKGMLFSNFVSKGIVLADFLYHFKEKPDVVVFVDDKVKNLYDVKKILDSRNTRSVLVKFSMRE